MLPNFRLLLLGVIILAYLALVYGLKPKPAIVSAPQASDKRIVGKLTEISKQLQQTNAKLGKTKTVIITKVIHEPVKQAPQHVRSLFDKAFGVFKR